MILPQACQTLTNTIALRARRPEVFQSEHHRMIPLWDYNLHAGLSRILFGKIAYQTRVATVW